MAADRSQFLLEMKEIKPEDVIAGYKAARAIPILDLLYGFLKGDSTKTQQWTVGLPCSKDETNTICEWAKVYFRDILQLSAEEILGTAFFSKETARELMILGDLFFYGLGVLKNREVAFHFYMRAADKEDAHGFYLVGFCQRCGFGVDKDVTEARKNLLKACSYGSVNAANELAMLIENEFPAEAVHHYTMGAAAGDVSALRSLGLCYKGGVLGVKRDLDIARKLFAASAFNGSPAGIRSYGLSMPYEEQWKYIRLSVISYRYDAVDGAKRIRDELVMRSHDPVPALTYHAVFALKETAAPEKLVELKKDFSNLCKTKPNEVKRLSQELGDTSEELLSMLDDSLKEMLALLCLLRDDTQFLYSPLFNLVLEYLEMPVFFVPSVLEKEKTARADTQAHLSKGCSSLFSQSAARAVKGEISYQEVMRNNVS